MSQNSPTLPDPDQPSAINQRLLAKAREAAAIIGSFPDVACVFLFGSVARGEATMLSDIDLGVVMQDEVESGYAGDAREGKREESKVTKLDLYTALAKSGYDSGIDITMIPRESILLRHEVAHYNRPLFEAPKFPRAEYIATALRDYEAHRNLFAIKRECMRARLGGGEDS